MGMNALLRRVSAADWKTVEKDADLVEAITAARFGRELLDYAAIVARMPWYLRWPAKLFTRTPKPQAMARAEAMPPAPVLDLHGSWHGLHWLLCQDAWAGPEPLRHAILGGQEVGTDPLGYGPPRLVEPARVADVSTALAALSAAQVMKRYDGFKMDTSDIYPGNFSEDAPEWRAELLQDYERLQKFYSEAAAAGDGVVSWIA